MKKNLLILVGLAFLFTGEAMARNPKPCTTDANCESTHKCFNGNCRRKCNADNTCPDTRSGKKRTCDTTNGICNKPEED